MKGRKGGCQLTALGGCDFKKITSGRVDLQRHRKSEQDFHEINRRSKVDIWDVLLSMIGTVGEPCLITEDPNFAIKNVGLFKSRSKTEGQWLYYLFAIALWHAGIKGTSKRHNARIRAAR